ncbi:SUZ domain-containing protein [Tropilaelaps mercedesae]|uniref:SUZ domain-containing protein n=1 Tax=Tropilaelaps mercedesae TaxID=418985 RepID=A0A1V9XTY6_9ACAR|nr:SUZ domain-containing protein [Tropilaelaps mercedesae]
MEVGGAIASSPPPALGCASGTYAEATTVAGSLTTTITGSKTKPRTKITTSGRGRQQQRNTPLSALTVIKSTTEATVPEQEKTCSADSGKPSNNIDSKHHLPCTPIIAETTTAAIGNNNNNNSDTSARVNEARGDTWNDANSRGKNVSEKKHPAMQQLPVDVSGDEFHFSREEGGSSASKTQAFEVNVSNATLRTQEDGDDEDNWESLIDSGILDKSLEKFRIEDRGVSRYNNANKDHQRDHQKKDKAKTPSAPIKIHVRLEEPCRTTTPPTFKILRREAATTGGVCTVSGVANREGRNIPKDSSTNGQAGEIRRSTGQTGVPTPPTGKTFAQRQEEYARARMRILGCAGNGNGLPATVPAATQQETAVSYLRRNHANGPLQSTQKPISGNVGRAYGSDSTGSGRRGGFPGGSHRRGGGHNSATSSANYSFGNSTMPQHHQNNNSYSNNGYYTNSRNGGGLHGSGSHHANSGGVPNSNSGIAGSQYTSTPMHRSNGGYAR